MASLIESVLAGLLLVTAGQPTAEAFPCERLGEEMVSVHDGFADSAPSVSGPVPVRRNAVLFDRTTELIAPTHSLADQGAATANGAMSPIVFRKYRRGEEAL